MYESNFFNYAMRKEGRKIDHTHNPKFNFQKLFFLLALSGWFNLLIQDSTFCEYTYKELEKEKKI